MAREGKKFSLIKRGMNVCTDFYTNVNKSLFYGSLIMILIGILMVYTASSYLAISQGSAPTAYMSRQVGFTLLGLLGMFTLYKMNIDKFKNTRWINLLLYPILLVLLVVLFIGTEINGAKGWISIFGIVSIQPIEFAKPIIVLTVANFISRHQREITTKGLIDVIKKDWKHAFAILAILVITFLFPDAGGVALVGSIVLFMLLGSGISTKWLKRFIAIAIIGYIIMIIGLHFVDLSHIGNYQIRRFVAFIDPFALSQGDGLQLVNSYYALALGGLFGRGPGNSIQKTGYLPEAHNDFIMAIVGEEFGFFVIVGILLLYFGITAYLFLKSAQLKTVYHQMILIGVGTYFFSQVFINLGGVLGLIPITGVTMPFLSYGGSSIITTCLMIGLALSAIRKDEDFVKAHTRVEN